MGLFVGLDVGTQSVKLVAYDPDMRQIVASAGQPPCARRRKRPSRTTSRHTRISERDKNRSRSRSFANGNGSSCHRRHR